MTIPQKLEIYSLQESLFQEQAHYEQQLKNSCQKNQSKPQSNNDDEEIDWELMKDSFIEPIWDLFQKAIARNEKDQICLITDTQALLSLKIEKYNLTNLIVHGVFNRFKRFRMGDNRTPFTQKKDN
jgi:hypothetical protein